VIDTRWVLTTLIDFEEPRLLEAQIHDLHSGNLVGSLKLNPDYPGSRASVITHLKDAKATGFNTITA
ncbi:hypothetical protein FRC17_008445, partial [Serendipita sp. 399]